MARRGLKPGRRLTPRLSVLGVVDDGGTDKVYLVWDHDQWCATACKVYRRDAQARREATILRGLDHPNIVRCLGVGRSPPHMLMEFLQGPTLRHLLRSQPGRRLSLSNALRVAVHIGSALHHIHARGYLHLDVKPANVIVVNGRPILFDVGTAMRGHRIRLPAVIGTDDYLSPEQCRKGVATTATDVFGLGVVLYQLLSGTLPYPPARRDRPLPPLRCAPRTLTRVRRSLPRGLPEIVMKCLAEDPQERPSLPALMKQLDGFIRTGPRMLPTVAPRARKPGRDR